MAETIAVISGVLLLALPVLSLWRRLSDLTLLDCFLLAIALYFGAYTLIDAITVESAPLDPLAVLAAFLIIAYSTLILWWFARRPSKLLQETSLENLRAAWQACPAAPIIVLVGVGVAYRWITAAGDFNPDDLSGSAESDLPYWFTSLGMIVAASIFPAGLCAWGKARASSGLTRLFWFALVAIAALIILGMGRRAIFAFLVIVGWDLMTQSLAQRKRFATVALLVLSIPLFVTISNVYQAYRLATVRGVPMESLASAVEDRPFLESAADLNSTIENLEARYAMWRFNYELVESHMNDRAELQLGWILVSGLQNFIPSALYPGKEIFDTEAETLRAFNLEYYDRSENVFASTYADFGFFSALAAPLLILAFVWGCAQAMRWFRDPFLRALLLGAAIFCALNMEMAYLAPLGAARDFAFVALVYITVRGTWRWVRSTVKLAAH